jgi:hypothetical protein
MTPGRPYDDALLFAQQQHCLTEMPDKSAGALLVTGCEKLHSLRLSSAIRP